MNKVIVENVKNFRVKHIFDCGQCFRWEEEEDGSYTGIAGGKTVNISEAPPSKAGSGKNIIIENATNGEYKSFWENYLDLNRDYGKIRKYLSRQDVVIREAMKYGQGIRILNQEKWEALISFIISANNNIPRIKKNINQLAETFGEKAGDYRGRAWYNLPTPEVLSRLTENDLAPIRLGYRAGYLIKTAKQVQEDGGKVFYEKLREYCGVGPKVANCISLFSMGKVDSFPIDTWVKKVMKSLYGIDEADTRAMEAFAKEKFSPYGGIAQQYLFYYMRETARD